MEKEGEGLESNLLGLIRYDQKSLMNTDTFDSKPSPSFSYTFILYIILLCSSFAYIYRKTQKTVQFEKVLKNEIKERNVAPLNWF